MKVNVTHKLQLALVITGVFAVFGLALPAAAHQESTVQPHAHADHQEMPHVEPPQQTTRLYGRLDEAKRKVCETRKATVASIMQKAADKGERNVALFKNIYDRVIAFYEVKKLNIANYSAIMASATSKYDAAIAAIKKVKDAPVLDCGGDNPVGRADEYKAYVAAIPNTVKDYRAAVHMVLVAVKNAAGGQK
jgi:hypothetical protein